MAKSFKQLAGSPPAKRTSEKDFLDFLEQDYVSAPVTPSSNAAGKVTAEQTPERSQPEIADQEQPEERKALATRKPEAKKHPKAQTESKTTTTATPAAKRATRANREEVPTTEKPAAIHQKEHHVTSVTHDTDVSEQLADVRQTFVLGQAYLENLKNFVHTRRMQGQYDFTQKEALHQALDLLFATAHIVERPDQIRQKEEVRRQQIRKGKSK